MGFTASKPLPGGAIIPNQADLLQELRAIIRLMTFSALALIPYQAGLLQGPAQESLDKGEDFVLIPYQAGLLQGRFTPARRLPGPDGLNPLSGGAAAGTRTRRRGCCVDAAVLIPYQAGLLQGRVVNPLSGSRVWMS